MNGNNLNKEVEEDLKEQKEHQEVQDMELKKTWKD